MARPAVPVLFLMACTSPQFEAWQEEHASIQETGASTAPTGSGSDMNGEDSAEHGTSSSTSSGASAGGSSADSTADTPDSTSETVTGNDGGTTGFGPFPVDLPPTVTNLACDPENAEEVGPVTCTYDASADATLAELLDDGQVVATGPAGDPLIFPVISAPHNNPGSTITVRVRDEAGQTAETSIYQPCTVKDPGTEVWTKLEPNDGMFSAASAVALHGDVVYSAGAHWQNPQVLGTLRRHDQAGDWIGTDEGWSKSHTEWTKIEWVKSGYLGPTGLAVDAGGNIILVGTAYENGQPRRYVARFHPDGELDWETAGTVGTEARAVSVQPDGTIYVAGSRRTGVNPDTWDMETSVFGPDKTAYGHFIYSDPEDWENKRSERGRAVAMLKNGRVVVGGSREMVDPDNPNLVITRGVLLLFEGKGKLVGEVWTSPGDKLKHDAILAAVATDAGFATCGYTHTNPNEPGSKLQILIRWHGEDLQEVKAPRLEATNGAAVCNALGYNMEGATIVGAQVYEDGQNNNQWIFAVEDAASMRVAYRDHNGESNGDDRVQALDCEYKCAWAGAESVDGDIQWIVGLIRG